MLKKTTSYPFIFVCSYCSRDIILCIFYNGELYVSVKILTISTEMLFYEY